MSSNSFVMSARDVHKRFGRLEVLKGVSLEVERGEVLCIIGPEGCQNQIHSPCSSG